MSPAAQAMAVLVLIIATAFICSSISTTYLTWRARRRDRELRWVRTGNGMR